MTEKECIEIIKKITPPPSRRVRVPIGDDAAVCDPPSHQMVCSVDALVEGTHFDLSYMTPKELGYKALAVNLSDIAAMAAEPLYTVVSLGLSDNVSPSFIEELYRGIHRLGYEYEIDIIGGNVVKSAQTWIDITIIGESSEPTVLRSGAQKGDVLAVSGPIGLSAAGLALLQNKGRDAHKEFGVLCQSHLLPEPRIREAIALRETGALTSMMDLSDGLGRDLHTLSQASNVGFSVFLDHLPRSQLLIEAGRELQVDPQDWILYGGEDYELLMTLQRDRVEEARSALQILGQDLIILGETTSVHHGVELITSRGAQKIADRGFDHLLK